MMKLLEKNTQEEYLNELLTRAYDAEEGFKVAADTAKNDALAEWFRANSDQRRILGKQLKNLLRSLNIDLDKGESLTGKMHQIFMKLRAAISEEQDTALIQECRRGEQAALADYQDALASIEFSPEARKMITDQKEAVVTQLGALDSIEKAVMS